MEGVEQYVREPVDAILISEAFYEAGVAGGLPGHTLLPFLLRNTRFRQR